MGQWETEEVKDSKVKPYISQEQQGNIMEGSKYSGEGAAQACQPNCIALYRLDVFRLLLIDGKAGEDERQLVALVPMLKSL